MLDGGGGARPPPRVWMRPTAVSASNQVRQKGPRAVVVRQNPSACAMAWEVDAKLARKREGADGAGWLWEKLAIEFARLRKVLSVAARNREKRQREVGFDSANDGSDAWSLRACEDLTCQACRCFGLSPPARAVQSVATTAKTATIGCFLWRTRGCATE